MPQPSNNHPARGSLSPEQYARLRAEIKAPYRGLRHFIYVAFGVSGLIGAVIFLTRLLAGQTPTETLPSLALQVGLVALMVWLYRIDRSPR